MNCGNDINHDTMKLIEETVLINGTIISIDCGNISIDYELVGVSAEERFQTGPDIIVAYNLGSTLEVYADKENEQIIHIFVGGINNQIDTGFDIQSLFKPKTFVAKFVFDARNNSLMYKAIMDDVDRRHPRFGKYTDDTQDERMWGDVRDMKLGDGCAVEQRVNNITGRTYLVEIPCLYIIGFSPSLRAAYIHKINVAALSSIPVKKLICIYCLFA